MDVEDHFGITMPVEECEHILTMRHLVDACYRRIEATQSSSCVTVPSFLRLRSVVREVTCNPTLKIKLEQKLINVLNPEQRKALWKRLPEVLKIRIEPLHRPNWMRMFLVLLSLAILIIPLYYLVKADASALSFVLEMILATAIIVVVFAWTTRFRVIPAKEYTTFGDVVQKIVSMHVATKNYVGKTRNDVFLELREIVIKVLNVKQEQVKLDASFVNDLGMN